MPDCIFCKIVAGDIPAAKLMETDDLLAFLDIGPINQGHVLLIPKAHHETLDQTPAELMAKLGAALPKLCAAVVAAAQAEGFNVFQTNHECAGQLVPHVHFHIVPRSSTDGFSLNWRQGKYEGDEMAQMQAAIQAELRKNPGT